MPANTAPIFTLVPNVSGAKVTAACTNSDGVGTIGTDLFKVFTAGSSGAWISKVRFNPVATVAATATTTTVGRVYLSSLTSGATTGGTNTWLLAEVTLTTQSADSSTVATNPMDVILNIAIPAGYTLLASTHAAPAANTSWEAIAIGGDY